MGKFDKIRGDLPVSQDSHLDPRKEQWRHLNVILQK